RRKPSFPIGPRWKNYSRKQSLASKNDYARQSRVSCRLRWTRIGRQGDCQLQRR
ncbi:hypothetical protein FOZ63_014353, partial [Perkinsus olseni]